MVISRLHDTSRLLRDLADRSQLHLPQVPVIVDYLNVILPCLSLTLRDIMQYYEDKTKTKEIRWRTMWNDMSNELPGTTLPDRFLYYNQFLELLLYMLTRNPNFDMNAMEEIRLHILRLRDVRGIDPPSPIRPRLARRDTALDFWGQEAYSHWAEAIFTQPMPSRREFRKRGSSDAYGPLYKLGFNPVSDNVKVLVKRSFDNDRVSVTMFLREADQLPFVFIRMHTASETWYNILPINVLTIERESSSVLYLAYWNAAERRKKAWASLSFLTWEELVLFYCTFASLKIRSPLPNVHSTRKPKVGREKRLFQAQIVEDNYHHCLMVFEDYRTKGRRLHVRALGGAFFGSPIWTAFLPTEPYEEWLIHKGPTRIWIRDLIVYSFCDEYSPHQQRRGKNGAFQIKFVQTAAATRFKQLFNPISTPSVESASEESEDEDSSSHSDE
ncbi:hypothetical protein F4808DRAFT_456765 [Astrocystis sublimbata]|nr:hypothetical protein F4808DRAFT_456765 [Astrocystis sublimbata]